MKALPGEEETEEVKKGIGNVSGLGVSVTED